MTGLMLSMVGGSAVAIPGAPTIGTVTIVGQTATVPFTAPVSNGGGTITLYTATSSPSGITGTLSQAGSGSVVVSGLAGGTYYTFTVTATNYVGTSAASAVSNSVLAITTGQQAYTTSGTYSWVAPAGATSVSVVCVGAGGDGGRYTFDQGESYYINGGGGGGLAYTNNISVTPGTSYTVIVGAAVDEGDGGNSTFNSTSCGAGGGKKGYSNQNTGGPGGLVLNGTGGVGGAGNGSSHQDYNTGGGGAGGYAGTGGIGRSVNQSGGDGAGGGGGGGAGFTQGPGIDAGAGGGVGIFGQGTSGLGGIGASGNGDGGVGSGPIGYGGGGTWSNSKPSKSGAVRIVWPGTTRSFPSTNLQDIN